MKKKFQTYCPVFPGFYGTLFEYDREGEDIEYYNEENKTDLEFDDFTFDYSEYGKRVCKRFVDELEDRLNDLLPIKIEFEGIHSPREYNFYNDSINVTITVSLPKLIKLIKQSKERTDMATEYLKDKYTSCSGFISFHSNQLEDWTNPKYILEEPAHRIGGLLDCLCHIEEITDDDIYDSIVDECSNIDFWPTEERQTTNVTQTS